MSRKDFYEMRIGEFFEALSAYREEKEHDRRHVGELVRGAAIRLVNLQLGKGDRFTDPAKFWQMPWDETTTDTEAEEIRRLQNLSDEERTEEAKKFLERIQNGR